MNNFNCPYCDKEYEYDTCDGGLPEDGEYWECGECDKEFLVTSNITIYFDSIKLNKIRMIKDYKSAKKDDIFYTESNDGGSNITVWDDTRGYKDIKGYLVNDGKIPVEYCEFLGEESEDE